MPVVNKSKVPRKSDSPSPKAELLEKWLTRRTPVCLVLAAAVIIIFWQVGKFDFVNYDDPDYVTANRHVQMGLTAQSIGWAFRAGFASNWHPLTWISHMLDWQLFGSNPGPHHLVSAGWHLINTLLLFVVLRRITGAHWRSAAVAALFGLHPLRAESVAWISERKDVLSAFFLLLTLTSYSWYVQSRARAPEGVGRRWIPYTVALFCFALGLMSKPMLVTAPFLLLLLDFWPFTRIRLEKTEFKNLCWLVLEKLPFLFLAAASSVVTFLVQQSGGAVSTSVSLSARIANALVSYARYLWKTIWPQNLSVMYPHPGHWPLWEVAGSALLLVIISIAVVRQLRARPYLATGWFWFLGTLVPVIGLIQVGIQSMADRYTYIPSIGLFLLVVWGIAELVERWSIPKPLVSAAAAILLIACCCAAVHQVLFWRDSEVLFQRAIAVTANNYLAYNNLGFYLSGKGKVDQAKEYYRKSIEINPLYPDALNNLGFALAGEKKFVEAMPYYERALRVSPNQPDIRNNLGNALSETGRINEAIEQYRMVIQRKPDHADAHNNLGIALAMQGKLDEAIEHFHAAIEAKPNYASAHSNLGNAFAVKHQIPQAIAEYQESLRLNPNDPQAHNNLANALVEQGKLSEAIDQYARAIQLNANNPEAHFNMAVAYLRQNNRMDAATHFEAALRLNPANAEARRQLQLLSTGK